MRTSGFYTIMKDKGRFGIPNFSNTCYINTILQCLGHCGVFLKFILSGKYKQRLNNEEDTPILKELRELYIQLWFKNAQPNPVLFLRMLQKEMGDWLNIYEQNDINEFIMFFIDKINAEIKTNMPIPPALSTDGSINKKKVSFVEKINQSWYQSNKTEYSELKDMFYGQSVTQIVCGGCNKIHHNYEIMMNMMLPIVADKDGAYTLQGCLEHHYADEKLNGNEGHDNSVWKCDHCDKKAESVKTIRAWRNPKVFVISIKRFNERLQKISTLVDIPLELDMSDYTIQINNGTPTKYELRSVGYHFGSFGGGHYVSMCKNYDDTWCIKDDDRIIQIKDTKQVLSDIKKGYMFFYEAIDI